MFRHVQQRSPEPPVCSGILRHDNKRTQAGEIEVDVERGNKRRLERIYTQKLALNRSAWKIAIHMSEP
jgi:hypothetical protein